MSETERYYLKLRGGEYQEVSQEDFILAERSAGFYPKSGRGAATGGFHAGNVSGKVEHLWHPRQPRMGEIYAHTEFWGTYCRVEKTRAPRKGGESAVVLFEVWEIDNPGWQGGAGLDMENFLVLYRDGPYSWESVEEATRAYRRENRDKDRDFPALGDLRFALRPGANPDGVEELISKAFAEHRRTLADHLEDVLLSRNEGHPDGPGLKRAMTELLDWKMAPGQIAPEGDQEPI